MSNDRGKNEPYGSVYFLSHGDTGPIKIGFTAGRDVKARIQQLQTGAPQPLTLIGTVLAYASIEKAIQLFMRPHLVRGEWYEREPALLLLDRFQITTVSHKSDFLEEILFLTITRRHDSDVEECQEPLSVRVARNLIWDWVDELRQVNTEKPIPFRAWLLSQKGRKDSVGDLARDAVTDMQFPATGSLVQYLNYLVERTSNAAVTRTLVEAWIESDMGIASLLRREQDVLDWDEEF